MLFESIVRHWCKTYHPMLDSVTNGNRRFFFADSMQKVVEMVKNFDPKKSPSVIMESGCEGGGEIARPEYNYPIYFFVRAREQADGDAAAEAIKEAKIHARAFLAWLKAKHDAEMEENLDGDFARIKLDGYVSYDTVGPLEDGWYAVLIQIEQEEPLNLCVDEDLYIEEE